MENIGNHNKNMSQIFAGLPTFNENMSQIFAGLPAFNENRSQIFAGLQAFNENRSQIFAGLPAFNENMSQIFAGLPAFNENLSQIFAGLPAFNENLSQIFADLPAFNENLSQIFANNPIFDEETTSAIRNIEFEINTAISKNYHDRNLDTLINTSEPEYNFDLKNISKSDRDILNNILVLVNDLTENNKILNEKLDSSSNIQLRATLVYYLLGIFFNYCMYAMC